MNIVGADTVQTSFFLTPNWEQKYGVSFYPSQDGTYRFDLVSGAYNPWPAPRTEPWLTTVYIYKNRAVEWLPIGTGGELVPGNPDYILYNIGDTVEVPLTVGDYVLLEIPDGISGYCGNGCQGGVTVDVTLEAPNIEILDAKMVSPNELGIGAIVTYPASCPRDESTSFTFTGTVDGSPINAVIDVPSSTNPGGEWGRMVSVDIDGKVLPTTPIRINLADQNIPKFTKNAEFTITGTASYEGSSQSEPSSFSDSILLPVILIHGVTKNWFENVFYPIGYSGLEDSLVTNGYIPDNEGYKTLWKVSEITYSSQEDTEQEVATKMDHYIEQATSKTYAAKVNLIGHSLGGLIGRFIITEHGAPVHKLIMIGTPNKGSTLLYTEAFSMKRADAIKKLTTSTDEPNLRQWFSPSYPNTLYEKSGKITTKIPNPDSTLSTNIFINLFKANGYDKPAPSGVTYYSIYNTKLSTPYSISVTWTKDNQWYKYGQTLTSGTGDKTVLADSANSPYAVSIPISKKTGHGGLASDKLVIQKVLDCLKD